MLMDAMLNNIHVAIAKSGYDTELSLALSKIITNYQCVVNMIER